LNENRQAASPHNEQAQSSSRIVGIWSGMVEFGDTQLPVVLRIDNRDSALTATIEFPLHKQALVASALNDVSFDHHVFRFHTRSFGSYEGHMSADGLRIVGALTNYEKRHGLTLTSGEIELAEPVRPQTPKPPFGYSIEHVRVDNPNADGILAGTLTMPTDRKPRAAAVLITGSGGLDRDETVFGHKPFWVLADHLSRCGYAVLRLDDRGLGESTGIRVGMTSADSAGDMSVALNYLQRRVDLQDIAVGLIGHSEGGLIAPMLAAQRADIAFVVSMAGPGITLGEVMAERECLALTGRGASQDTVVWHGQFARALFRQMGEMPVSEMIDAAQVAAIAARFGAAETAIKNASDVWLRAYNLPWFRYAFRHDPAESLKRMKAPFLAINGSLDAQVPVKSNLGAMAQILAAAGHPDFEIVELPGLNHMFRTCSTGEEFKYPMIEETFAPLALDTISAWLDARFE